VAKRLLDKLVQIRLGDALLTKMAGLADRRGVHVAVWARDAILATVDDVSPAKVPRGPAGREKVSLRFRTIDFKRVEIARERSGRGRSDFLRGVLAYAAGAGAVAERKMGGG
jgi:hypothetical protein